MKKIILILVMIIAALLYYTGALTKKETLPFSKEFFSIESPVPAERSWDLKKSTPPSQKELDQLYQLKLDQGTRNIPLLSLLLIRDSEKARAKGDTDQAVRIATYAVKFSPDLPHPYFGLAQALWHQNPFQLQKILPEMLKGGIRQFRYYPHSLRLFYNMFYILTNAILIAFLIFGIVIMIRYLPLYFYEIRKNVNQEVSKLLLSSLKIFILFIPVFLRLDVLWAVFFWSVLLWGYVTNREKQLIFVFLIVLVYLPFFLRSSSSFLDGNPSDIIIEMNQINQEDGGRPVEERLRKWLTIHPDDSEVLFSLGLAEKRRGRYPEAEALYRKAIQQDAKFSEAFSNLGNVYLAQKKTPLAIASYQQAADLDPHRGSYYYNLYRAYSQETFLSGKIDKAFQRARQLDPRLVDYYSTIDSPHPNRLVIDETLTSRTLWTRFLHQFIGREGFLFRLFRAWFEKIPSRVPFLAPLLFLGFLIAMSRYCRTKRFLTRCPRCGSPTYRFYLGTSEQEFICFNCYRLFIQKEKLHPKMIEKKSIQVHRYQSQNHLISRFVSFFLVGFGYLWREEILKGLFFLVLFFIFILKFVYWRGVMPSALPSMFSSFWSYLFWGGLFLIFYIFSVRSLFRLKPKFEAENQRPKAH